ncbi:hypothetical protein DdX_16909 [Ditylenchus destructor]|uniref:Uncharacterized protein n=1 Tax=Ditylenchus destructor TaxID=166010 RepID=A0AAD4QZG6_9BILA|nr:hypothetical protein DdX_16909 [Ditylenchus destructor]
MRNLGHDRFPSKQTQRHTKSNGKKNARDNQMGPTNQRIHPPKNTSQGHSPGSSTTQVQMGRPRSKKRKRKTKEATFWEPKDSKGKTIEGHHRVGESRKDGKTKSSKSLERTGIT